MIDNDTLDMHSSDLVDQNINKLAEIFPNCITESRDSQGNLQSVVDFDLLRQELSRKLVEGGQERYRLDWPGKRQAILEANSPIAKTLRPTRDESINFDTTENLFIEGDNLEALKLLQESYLGQVKMIYIDPPYNTGNDFIYEDDFSEDTTDFLERSEQIDEDGNRLVTNTESNGRFHSDWLTMMYSRLKLARTLLKDDGVIFISIDDNEQANLKKICDSIFGQSNFIDPVIWKKRYGGGAKEKFLVALHEYVLVYAKDKTKLSNFYKPLSKEQIDRYYTNKDEFYKEKGGYRTHPLEAMKSFDARSNLNFPIPAPDGQQVYPKRQWRWSKDRVKVALENNEIEFNQNKDSQWILSSKQYLIDSNGEIRKTKPFSIIDDVYTQHGTNEILRLLGNTKVFDFPKPSMLIYQLLIIGLNYSKDEIILDFFAGSSTTAHAVMQLNAEDEGNRKFIMVQVDEPIDPNKQKDAFMFCEANKFKHSIAEISKERIRRAGQKILADNQDKDGIEDLDIGFRVLKIDSTNMKDVYYTPDNYEQAALDNLESHIKEDRTGEDLLFQVMLDWGVPLSLPIEVKEIKGSSVYYVGIDSLVACFDTLSTNLIDEISKDKPLKFVSSELAIAHDQDKTNIKARFAQLSPDTQVKFI